MWPTCRYMTNYAATQRGLGFFEARKTLGSKSQRIFTRRVRFFVESHEVFWGSQLIENGMLDQQRHFNQGSIFFWKKVSTEINLIFPGPPGRARRPLGLPCPLMEPNLGAPNHTVSGLLVKPQFLRLKIWIYLNNKDSGPKKGAKLVRFDRFLPVKNWVGGTFRFWLARITRRRGQDNIVNPMPGPSALVVWDRWPLSLHSACVVKRCSIFSWKEIRRFRRRESLELDWFLKEFMVKFVWVPSSCIATLVVVRFYPFTTTTTLTHQILKISSKEVLKPCGLILRNTGWSQNGWRFQWKLMEIEYV